MLSLWYRDNFHSHANQTHFQKKGCALGLILKVRVFRTRKWPIPHTWNYKGNGYKLSAQRFLGYLVYIFKIFTQLNRDSHWLILDHVALTKIKSVYPDRHLIKHGGKAAWQKPGKPVPAFTIVVSKNKPAGASSEKVMIFEVIQGKWRKEMQITHGKYFKNHSFKGFENLVNIFV